MVFWVYLQLLGFGSSVLENVDPNPDNFVMAGIVHTRQSQIGALMRLEANKQAMVCIHTTFEMQYLSLYPIHL